MSGDRWDGLRAAVSTWGGSAGSSVADSWFADAHPTDVAALLAERDTLAAALAQAVRTLGAIESQEFVTDHDATCSGCLGDQACDLGDWLDKVAAVRGELRAALASGDPR